MGGGSECMIQLGKKTKLTTDVEKAFVELGGGDPNKTLAENELRVALPKAIDIVAEHRPSILRKIYDRYVAAGELPPIEKL